MDSKPQIKQFADELRIIKIAEKQQLKQAIFMRRRRQEISTLEDFQQRKKRQLENTFEENNNIKCHICKDYFIHMTITQCGHQFCYQCLFEHLLKKHRCPQCSKQLKGLQFIHCSIIDNIVQKVVATTQTQNEQFRKRELQLTETFASKILNQYEIGQDIDVLDTEHIWCIATIKGIRQTKIPQLLIHYKGWNKIYDEYISINSPRLSPLGTYTNRNDILLYKQSNNEEAISNYVTNQSEPQPSVQVSALQTQSIYQTILNNYNIRIRYNQFTQSQQQQQQQQPPSG